MERRKHPSEAREGSECACLQSLEGLQQRRLTRRERPIALQAGERPGLSGPASGKPEAILEWLIQEKVTAWLAAQGWTFAEMTEAQKFEMRSTLNICGYATSGSKRTRPCARAPEIGDVRRVWLAF